MEKQLDETLRFSRTEIQLIRDLQKGVMSTKIEDESDNDETEPEKVDIHKILAKLMDNIERNDVYMCRRKNICNCKTECTCDDDYYCPVSQKHVEMLSNCIFLIELSFDIHNTINIKCNDVYRFFKFDNDDEVPILDIKRCKKQIHLIIHQTTYYFIASNISFANNTFVITSNYMNYYKL